MRVPERRQPSCAGSRFAAWIPCSGAALAVTRAGYSAGSLPFWGDRRQAPRACEAGETTWCPASAGPRVDSRRVGGPPEGGHHL